LLTNLDLKQELAPYRAINSEERNLKVSHASMRPGLNPGLLRATFLSLQTMSWAGCVLGIWWFPLYELPVYSSTWNEAEALSEYGVVTE
jgi:hypothetical protein